MHPPFRRCAEVFLLTLLASMPAVPAAAAVHLSIAHPWSTNPDPDASATFAVSLFHSRIGTLHGVGIHPIVSQVGGSKSGFDVVGIYNSTGGDWRGVSLTGAIGAVHGAASGIQLSGIANFDHGSFRGFQSAGLLNTVRGDVSGVQLATFVNHTAGSIGFLQISTVANISEGSLRGAQIGGLNFAQAGARGLQVGLGNVAGSVSGAQAGLFNFAGDASGLQLGAINVAGTNHGVPIGLLNRARNGQLEAVAFTSTFSAVNLGVRTTVNRFQSTFSVGGFDLEGDVSTAGFVSWNYGVRLPLSARFDLGVDAGFTHVMPEKSDDPTENDRLHFGLLARVLPEYRISPRWAIFGGGGIATIFDEYSSHAKSETVGLLTAGVAVTP